MATIDIVVPVYNVEKYIKRCIDSLIHQTFKDIRILLIDDGSTDQSAAICDAYAEQYENITVLHKENGGLSSARNAALGMAKAEYIMFLDSDDYYDETVCEKAYTLAERENADVVAFGIALVGADGRQKPYGAQHLEIANPEISEEQRKQLVFCFGHVVNKLYRRECVEGVRFPEGLILEDYFWSSVIASRVERLCFLEEDLYYYCTNPQSITHAPNPLHKFDKFKIMELIIEYYREQGLYDPYYESIEYLCTMFCFVNGCKSAILGYENPYDVVDYAVKMMHNQFPKFYKNRYYKARNVWKVRALAQLLYHWPRLYIALASLKKRVKK